MDSVVGPVWNGSLLPAFWVHTDTGRRYVHSCVEADGVLDSTADRMVLRLSVGPYGRGSLIVSKHPWGISFDSLRIKWTASPPAIISMYLGTSVPPDETDIMVIGNRPFCPDWQAAGYCIPGGKEGPVQSFFRSWDLGRSEIALGSFGPSMGAPYSAAFPRPLLFAAMGNDKGWVSFGAGSIPDAPLSMKLAGSRGCFEYVYREDKWGVQQQEREWPGLLRITVGRSAYSAFAAYYASFDDHNALPCPNLGSAGIWNSWGMWRQGQYAIPPLANFAQKTGAHILVLDEGWESADGSGIPNRQRFGNLSSEMDSLRSKGLSAGFWQSLGWVADTSVSIGGGIQLGAADLIVDQKGKPVKTNWNFDPFGPANFCLDISSPRARDWLRQRTINLLREYKPRLLKLDFGYALPPPDIGVPRDPAIRGERYCAALIQLIAEAARSVDPNVLIMYYGISPLFLPLVNIVSLDDQGDLWYAAAAGHAEWSIWASLAGLKGVALSGSSGYRWEDDKDVVLNSIILGIPGAVLPSSPDHAEAILRRWAANSWYRKTTIWQPRWYNSYPGGLDAPPQLKCWGREEIIGGKRCLTALTLRGALADPGRSTEGIRWSGDWGIIAQDDADIEDSRSLVLIPFTPGRLSLPMARRPTTIQQMSPSRRINLRGWTWLNNRLIITVTDAMLRQTAGFLVSSK